MSASENQWLSAWHLFQLLRSDGVLVSTVPFNAVASACEKAAEWENALHLVAWPSDMSCLLLFFGQD